MSGGSSAPPEARQRDWPDSISGIWDAFVDRAGRTPDRLAFVVDGVELTFSDVLNRGIDSSTSLAASGVTFGSRVAIAMSAAPEWVPLFFGLCRLGAVILPLNTRLTAEEIVNDLRDAGTDFVVTPSPTRVADADFVAALLAAMGADDPRTEPEATGDELGITRCRPDGSCAPLSRLVSGDAAAAVAAEECAARVTRDSPFVIMFTSGSTGRPKAALLRQWPALLSMEWCNSATGMTDADVFFSPLPFHHAGGLFTAMAFPISPGGTMVVQSRWDARAALETMVRTRSTATIGHQPHWVEYLALADGSFPVRRALTLAPSAINRRVASGLGLELCSLYGMTEMHLAGTVTHASDPEDIRLDSVGTQYPGVELAIVDPADDVLCANGEAGEVRFRGWPVMSGYLNDLEETGRVVVDGWYRTGDLGSVDDHGNLRLHGRIKEMIRVGGENVSPGQVEAVLMSHPGVRQAVVAGAPDDRLGEVCVAAVELTEPGATTPEALTEWARTHLAKFKVPRRIVLVQTWPMNGPGKIARATVRSTLLVDPHHD